jgi:PKD repeat protein
MKSLTSWFARSTALLLGVGGMLVLASCMDRTPTAVDAVGPLTSQASSYAGPVLGAFGTPELIDGVLDAGWSSVSPQTVTVGLTGNREAVGKVYLMNDVPNLYFAITLTAPPPQNNVIRLVLDNGASSHVITISGGGTTPTVTGADQVALGNPDSEVKRIYEGRKSLPILGISSGDGLRVRVEFEPGGNASPTYFPAANEFVDLRLYATAPPTVVANANGPYPGIGEVAYSHFTPIVFSSAGSTTGEDVTYLWDFGTDAEFLDGPSTSNDSNPTRKYKKSGVYTATLTVTKGGISAVSTAEVTITPNVQVTVLRAEGQTESRCKGMTVTARNSVINEFDDFHAILSNDDCIAGFDLPSGKAYVFSVRNTLTAKYDIWPIQDLSDGEVSDILPKRLGAVCIEEDGACNAGTSSILTPTTYEEARNTATPLDAPRPNLEIEFQLTGRTIPCTVPGQNVFVHAQIPLPSKFQQPAFAPPALGLYIDKADQKGNCELNSIPYGELVVVESIDEDGNTATGVIGSSGNGPIVLSPDPDLYNVTKIWDDIGDNPSGKDDIFLTRMGVTKDGSGDPTNTLLVNVLASKLQETGTAQFQLSFTDVQGPRGGTSPLLPSSVQVRVICSKQKASCTVSEVSPSAASQYVTVSGNPTDGVSSVELRMNITGVQSLKLRVRAGVSNGFDYSPDLSKDPFLWTWPGDSNTFKVAW